MATSISSAVRQGHEAPPGTTAFNVRPLGMPPPTLVDHLPKVVAHGQFVDARLGDVATQKNSRVPPFFGVPHFAYQSPAAVNNVRHIGQRLGIIDDRGPAPEANDRREGRPDARYAALAFEPTPSAPTLRRLR